MERNPRGHNKTTRSVSSNRWMHRHVTDPYVQQAHKAGYRSRAAFKIIAIDDKFHLFDKAQTIIDLGSTPGSWSQVALERAGKKRSRILAVDLVTMPSLLGVECMQSDFTLPATLSSIREWTGVHGADLILSDLSPTLSGIKVSDQARVIDLSEQVLCFAREGLCPTGILVAKTFQGAGFPELLKTAKQTFTHTHLFKPPASRSDSPECYLIGLGLRAIPLS